RFADCLSELPSWRGHSAWNRASAGPRGDPSQGQPTTGGRVSGGRQLGPRLTSRRRGCPRVSPADVAIRADSWIRDVVEQIEPFQGRYVAVAVLRGGRRVPIEVEASGPP